MKSDILAKDLLFLSCCTFLVLVFSFASFDSNSHLGDVLSDTGQKHEYSVELTDSGFVPAEITISKGDRVIFKTERSGAFWPASNIHPTHNIYPEFNPRRPLAPGEEFSFQFDKVGSWDFHDHLSPGFGGTITVLDEEGKGLESPCKSSGDSPRCFQKLLVSTLYKQGVGKTFDLISKFYSQEPDFPKNCHGYAHDIGIASYKLYLADADSVLSPKASYCANGFYHGFMEAFLGATRDVTAASVFCDYIGEKLGEVSPDSQLHCYHGIGHGALETTLPTKISKENELAILKPSLDLCERGSDTKEKLYRCVSGAYNSLANFYILGSFGLKPNLENPFWVCDRQADKYQEACYGNFNVLLYSLYPGDFGRAISFAEKIKDDKFAIPTMRYLVGAYALSFGKADTQKAINECRRTQPRLQAACIEGFASGLLEHGTPGLEYKDALSFCRTDSLEGNEKEVCFKYILSALGSSYAKEKAESVCQGVESEYRKYCKLL